MRVTSHLDMQPQKESPMHQNPNLLSPVKATDLRAATAPSTDQLIVSFDAASSSAFSLYLKHGSTYEFKATLPGGGKIKQVDFVLLPDRHVIWTSRGPTIRENAYGITCNGKFEGPDLHLSVTNGNTIPNSGAESHLILEVILFHATTDSDELESTKIDPQIVLPPQGFNAPWSRGRGVTR
jgi:hypothetical protein